MKKVSKKKSSKATTPRRRTKKEAKRYPAYLLGILLVAVLLSQSALMLNATASDWKAGVSVLDISSGISSMASDVKFAMQPATDTIFVMHDFLDETSNVTTKFVDLSGSNSDPLMAITGVNNFYQLAANEMAHVLDLSNYTTTWQPQVAGASISR